MPARDATFAIALPPDWRQIDLLSAEAEQVFASPLAQALGAAGRGSEHARLLMLRALIAASSAKEPLAAGLAVTLADRSAPVSRISLSVDSFEGADVCAVALPVASGLRLRRVAPATVLSGAPPIEVLRVEYLLDTDCGLLTIGFTTPQASRTAEWEQLFHAIASTAKLE